MKANTENASYLMDSTAAVQVNDSQIDDRVGTRPASDQRSTCDVRGGAQAAQGGVGGVVDGQGGRSEQGGSSTSAEGEESRQSGAPGSSSREIESPGTSQRHSSGLAEQPQSLTDSEERLAVNSEELEGETSQEPFAKQLKRIEEAEIESVREFLLEKSKKRVRKASTTRWTLCGKTKRSNLDIENQLTPKLPESYLEIKRLLWVEGQKIHKKALEVWREKEVLFTKRVERKKSKVAELKNEVYQLIGFFSVFQGVVLTAVAQASQLHCYSRWIPISLSILASVVTIAGVIQKLDQISAFQKTVHSEEQSLKVCHLFSAILFTTKF